MIQFIDVEKVSGASHKEMGFDFPLLISESVWSECVNSENKKEEKRTMDRVIMALGLAIIKKMGVEAPSHILLFRVPVYDKESGSTKIVSLKAQSGSKGKKVYIHIVKPDEVL